MERKCTGSLDPSQNPLHVLVRRCPIYAWHGTKNQFVFLTWDLWSVKHLLYYDKLLPREWYGDSQGIKQALRRVPQWHNAAVGPCAGVPASVVAPGQCPMASLAVPAFPKDTLLPPPQWPCQNKKREAFVSHGQSFPTVAFQNCIDR